MSIAPSSLSNAEALNRKNRFGSGSTAEARNVLAVQRVRPGASPPDMSTENRLKSLRFFLACQRLPGAPPGEQTAECTGGACTSASKSWIAEGCMTVDDGTAECRLWSTGEILTKGVLRVAPSVLTQLQSAAMRLGPQCYSAAGALKSV